MFLSYNPRDIIKNLFALSGLMAAITCTNLNATTILGMDINQVAQDAEFIFEGEVISRETRQNSSSGIISTYVTFGILDVVKGDYDADSVELKFMGGVFNDQMVAVSGLTIPPTGEQGIYFVESVSRDLINPLLGWSQGHFIIIDDNGERRVSTVDKRPVIDILTTASIPLTIKKPQALFEGKSDVANGVATVQSSLRISQALSVDEFKSRIHSLLDN